TRSWRASTRSRRRRALARGLVPTRTRYQRIERRVTLAAQLATRAFGPTPDPVEAFLRGVEHPLAVGEEPHLEVAASFGLRPQPRSREVCAPEIEMASVDGDHLEVHARASADLHRRALAGSESRHLASERARRCRGMKEPNVDAAPREISERLEERDVAS